MTPLRGLDRRFREPVAEGDTSAAGRRAGRENRRRGGGGGGGGEAIQGRAFDGRSR